MDQLDEDEDEFVTLNGKPFTGVAFEDTHGGGVSELHYVEGGLRYGVDKAPNGTPLESTEYQLNAKHGVELVHGPDGRVRARMTYEFGMPTRREEVGTSGGLEQVWAISPADPRYSMLQLLRRLKK